jgi:RNA polymerase sigma-70 factor (ECF subfamily)
MKENHQKRIELVFRDHYREFCLLSYSYVACIDQAEDIVQDVFVKLLAQKEISRILSLKDYIWLSVKNNSLKHLERSKKLELLEYSALVLAEEDDTWSGQLDQKLQKTMDKLPSKCKKVFELCAVEGKKYNSAADDLGISVNTVKTQMKKAYKILRYELRNVYLILLIFVLNC